MFAGTCRQVVDNRVLRNGTPVGSMPEGLKTKGHTWLNSLIMKYLNGRK